MQNLRQNRGEWSELYAFLRLLKEGRIYAADEKANRIEDTFFPILKIIKTDDAGNPLDYKTGETIRIYKDGELIEEVAASSVAQAADTLFDQIFKGSENEKGAFEIPEIALFLEKMRISKPKASAKDKADILMQIHDIRTGHDSVEGFSIKSDLSSPPILLNAGRNTRFKYEILGISDADMTEVNAIDKSVDKEYMKARISLLFRRLKSIRYHGMLSETYEGNLVMIDSRLPEMYSHFILCHYLAMQISPTDCESLCGILESINPLGYRRGNVYAYKIKKLLCASALGMTPGTEWDGYESATGGYVIVKRDGDVVCYHLYNRISFEEYLLKNTVVDRPSATRYDYGYVYKEDGRFYIDLNIQIRFKSINAGNRADAPDALKSRLLEYIKKFAPRIIPPQD